MAGRDRLSVRRPIRFAAVVAAVVALHAYVLHWADEALGGPPPLQAMSNPMFTRVLAPEAPPPPQAARAAPPPKNPGAITAARVPPRPKRAASQAMPAAPEAQAVASAPAPDASAPEPAVAAASAASAATVASSAASAPLGPAMAADNWPADTRVSYKLTGYYRGDLIGDARVQWQRQGERYQARVDLDVAIFRMTFLSQGEVAGDSLSPRAYQETTPNRTRLVQISADAVVLNDGRTVPKPPSVSVQDTASQFVELGHRFATGKDKLETGGTVPIWLARPGGMDEWIYDIVGRETLATPQLGPIEAYHLKPRLPPNPRGNITAEIWFAPTLQYMPVRVKINVGTEAWADLLVDKIEQR